MATMDSGFSARQVFFHGLPSSRIIENAQSAAEAVVQSGLDWTVDLRPMAYEADDGSFVDVPNRFLSVRSDTGLAFGPVGNQYEVLQNAAAFEWADALLGYGVEFEAGGSWKGGSKTFLTAKLPEGIKVEGEEALDLYLLMSNSHDGSAAVSAILTPVRLSCTNQLALATRSAVSSWRLRHTSTIADRLEEAKTTLKLVDSYRTEFEAITAQLQSIEMSTEEFEGFTKELTESVRLQEGMKENWLTSETHARTNRWDSLQAVTEYVEWGRGGRGNAESRFESNLFGQGAAIRNRAATLLLRR